MADLFQTGHIADIVMALMALEACALALYWRSTGAGLRPLEIVTTLAAGVFLFLALRLALTGSDWQWIALALVLSLIAHMADLTSRWRGR